MGDLVQASMTEPRFRNHGWYQQVWLGWVACTAAGYIASGITLTVVPTRVRLGSAFTFVVVAVGVAMVGLLQWLVLRRCAPRLKWWSWVLATVLGQFAATLLVTLAVVGSLRSGVVEGIARHVEGRMLQLLTKLVSGALLGGIKGFAQWLVLRRYFPAAAWWIGATILAESLAAAMSLTVYGGATIAGPVALATAQMLAGLIMGSITGMTLVWLSRQPRRAAASA